MKSQIAFALALITTIGISAVGLRSTWAQDNKSMTVKTGASGRAVVVQSTGVSEDSVIVTPQGRKSFTIRTGQLALTQAKIREAAEKLRDAEDEEAKAAARKELAEVLGKYFDEDMSHREDELAKLEQRLTKLREQLDRRREKRQEIIDLQIQVSLNEAEGLGFVSRDSTAPFGWRFGNDAFGTRVEEVQIQAPYGSPTPQSEAKPAPFDKTPKESEE